jgi:hypothetical protein
MQNEKILLENFRFFLSKKRELLSDPNKKHKFVVIFGEVIKGFFENFEDAHMWAKGEFLDDNFIIQQIIDEDEITDFIYEAICR